MCFLWYRNWRFNFRFPRVAMCKRYSSSFLRIYFVLFVHCKCRQKLRLKSKQFPFQKLTPSVQIWGQVSSWQQLHAPDIMCWVCQRDVTTLCFPPFNKNKLLVIAVAGRWGFPCLGVCRHNSSGRFQCKSASIRGFSWRYCYEQPDTPQTVGRLPIKVAQRYQLT